MFIDWLIYYYIDTTQREGSYQIPTKDSLRLSHVYTTMCDENPLIKWLQGSFKVWKAHIIEEYSFPKKYFMAIIIW